MRVDMFVYNRCTSDARVLKEARTLTEAGHRVRIIAVLDQTTAPEEKRDGFRIVRIDRNPIHYRLLRAVRTVGRFWRRPLAAIGPQQARASTRGPRGAAGLVLAPIYLLERGIRRLLLIPHKPLMFLDYYQRAYRLVRASPPNALHAHDLNTLPVAAALARRLRLPLTYDAHELYPEISTLSRREAAVWGLIERRLAGRADHVLTVCDSIADELVRRYGIAPPTVLLNCPAPGQGPGRGAFVLHSGTKAPDPLRGRAGLNGSNEPLVLYQGGFAPHRGLETLIRSAHRLQRGVIVLMGWGPLEEGLRAQISREGLTERVRITAPVPPAEVIAYATGATVGVIPYEPVGLNNAYSTPNKLFDYMAAGLPVAASRLPELTRFVEHGGIGLTFTPGDPVTLAESLNAILTDSSRYAAMRDRARQAAARYTWERESTKLLALYGGAPTATPSPR